MAYKYKKVQKKVQSTTQNTKTQNTDYIKDITNHIKQIHESENTKLQYNTNTEEEEKQKIYNIHNQKYRNGD